MVKDPKLDGGDVLLNHFEILEPSKRTASILGEEVDLTIIPARVALKFISFSKKHDAGKLETMGEDDFDDGMIEDIVEIIAMICQRSNKTITKDWLFDNLDIRGLLEFTKFVFAGLTQIQTDNKGAAGGKN